jgi:hypothetical protein
MTSIGFIPGIVSIVLPASAKCANKSGKKDNVAAYAENILFNPNSSEEQIKEALQVSSGQPNATSFKIISRFLMSAKEYMLIRYATEALGKFDTEETFSCFEGFLKRTDIAPGNRQEALETIGHLSSDKVKYLLLKYVYDNNEFCRAGAFTGLIRYYEKNHLNQPVSSEFVPHITVDSSLASEKDNIKEKYSRMFGHLMKELLEALQKLGLDPQFIKDAKINIRNIKIIVYRDFSCLYKIYGAENVGSARALVLSDGTILLSETAINTGTRDDTPLSRLIIHELLHMSSSAVKKGFKYYKAFNEVITELLTYQVLQQFVGVKSDLGRGYIGNVMPMSYKEIAQNIRFQKFIDKIRIDFLINSYISGDIEILRKRCEKVFGMGSFDIMFPKDTEFLKKVGYEGATIYDVFHRLDEELNQRLKFYFPEK